MGWIAGLSSGAFVDSRGLNDVYLSDCGATAAGIQNLLPALGDAEHLNAGKQDIGDSSAQALAPLPLHTLKLVDAGISGIGAAALLQHGQAQNPHLDGNDLSALPELDGLSPRLVVLACSGCNPAGNIAKLTRSEHAGLQLLRLHDNELNDADLDALANAPWLANLKGLRARNTNTTTAARNRLKAAWGNRPGLSIR